MNCHAAGVVVRRFAFAVVTGLMPWSCAQACEHHAPTCVSSAAETLPLPGQEVESLLEIQRNGDMQSSLPQSVSSAYHEKAAQRFMKTLDQAIPAASQGR